MKKYKLQNNKTRNMKLSEKLNIFATKEDDLVK